MTTTDDELLTELMAHAIVLRARAHELAQLVSRTDVSPSEVIGGATRIADRASEVLRIARQLVGESRDLLLPTEDWKPLRARHDDSHHRR